MAIFNPNKLRIEEKLGDFQPGDFDDESFQLNEMDAYPGTLPSFEFEDNSISEMVAAKEGRDFVKPVPKKKFDDDLAPLKAYDPNAKDNEEPDKPFAYGNDLDLDSDDEPP